MFYSSIYFFPSIICLGWLILYLFRRKNTSQKVLSILLFLEILHCASQAFFVSPEADYVTMCYWDIISQPLILCTVALACIYSHVQYKGKLLPAWQMEIFFIPALMQAIAVWILYGIIGIKDVARFFEASDNAIIASSPSMLFDNLPAEFNTTLYHIFSLFDGVIFNFWCLVFSVSIIIICLRVGLKYGHVGDGVRFWFKGGNTTPQIATSYWLIAIIIIYIVRVLLGRTYLYANPSVAICMALLITSCIFCMSYCEYFSHLPNYTLYGLTHADLLVSEEMAMVSFENEKKLEQEGGEQSVVDESQTDEINSRVEERNRNLSGLLKRELEVKKIYTDSNLTLEFLAKRLGTNRNKLSGIVSQVYGMDFRNAVARLRIEEAKRLMMDDPTITAEAVALKCGFKDSSAFFHRFKDFTGLTPRMWIMQKGSKA